MIGVVASGMPVAWLIARAAGLVAFALLTVSVTLGLAVSTKLLKPRWQKTLFGWHQTLIWTGLAMVILHAGAILFDPVMRFGLPAVFIPGVAPWRPITVAAGVVAGYLMLTLALSFQARRRIGQRHWRLLHYASFLAFALALGHALHAGTDLTATTGLVFAAIVLAPVLWLTFARILMPRAPRPLAAPRKDRSAVSTQRGVSSRRADTPRSAAGVIGARLVQEPFRAMGTDCLVAVTARHSDMARARRALASGRREVETCEQVLSRFLPESDLSRLNRASGRWTTVDERLIEALRVALRTREETGGKFDPTILPALAAAGYDRSFEQLNARPPTTAGGWRPAAIFEVDRASLCARVEVGAAVDLGGLGKGLAASRALWAMREAWLEIPGGLVDLGGDIAVWGATPDGGPWRLSVADPRAPGSSLATVAIDEGAVATSGRDRRRFGPDRQLHHLIDPATGTSADSGPLAATVVGWDGGEVEAYATALAITPVEEAADCLRVRPGLSALLVSDEGGVVVVGDLPLLEDPRLAEVIA